MIRSLLLACVSLLPSGGRAQSRQLQQQPDTGSARFVGNWQGTLAAGPTSLRLGLAVRRDSANVLRGALVSIDQGGVSLPTQIVAHGDTLVATVAAANARFTAVIAATRDTLRGTFTQGAAMPLVMTRVAQIAGTAPPTRPQDPKPPFPYRAEEVSFASAPGVTLAGTLTVPNGTGPFPAVALITGSGPQDRDETLMGHRPFAVIADYLTRRGVAVLRVDDRGVGKSTGDFAHATSEDFANDAEAAVRFLKSRRDVSRVGLMGHSEGGLIAPMVAARSRDVSFVVLLAGPGLAGDSILILQNRAIEAASGMPGGAIASDLAFKRTLFDAAKGAKDSADATARVARAIAAYVATLPEAQRDVVARTYAAATPQLVSPWMRYFLAYDPRPALAKVRVPLLALNGTLDLQVPYRENLAAIDGALAAGGNRDHETVALPNLNHLFQTAHTGLPAEYQSIEETFSPSALQLIADWIEKRFIHR